MMLVFLRYLQASMRQNPLDMTNKILKGNPIHQRLVKAIGEQTEIGLGHALRGRLSKEWGEIHAVDTASDQRPHKGAMVNLIYKLWGGMTKMWKVWNKVQHGVTKEERRKIANEKVLH